MEVIFDFRRHLFNDEEKTVEKFNTKLVKSSSFGYIKLNFIDKR